MLINFRFSNYRSFRDPAELSMEALGVADHQPSLLYHGTHKYLPGAAIYGKNGGGKSNVIRAFWLGVQFIRNAQRTQHESASVPVRPFALNDYSESQPTSFEYQYILDDIRYTYGFSATREKILSEYLSYAPRGRKTVVFERKGQQFTFPKNQDKKLKELISRTVAENQLFFSIACTMNYKPCICAMKWFRDYIYFSRNYTDIQEQIAKNAEEPDMLKAIVSYAKRADVGIENMKFEVGNVDFDGNKMLPANMPENVKEAFANFMHALAAPSSDAEAKLKISEVKASSLHKGVNRNGKSQSYQLGLFDESDGTRSLMAIAPAIERVLNCGGLFMADELDKGMHPTLVKQIVALFQSPKTNRSGAQIVFTTHDTELLNLELLRKDQLYFVDKNRDSGASELYGLDEYATHTRDNIQKGYMAGKYGAVPDIEIEEIE